MNIKSIVKLFLEQNGYDGLFDEDNECACELSDLMPCDSIYGDCEPGYKINGCTCGDGCDYHIVKNKPS